MAGKDDLIVDLLKEVREEQKTHSTILTEVQIDLAEHKEGVEQCRARLDTLEEPRKAFKLLKKYLIGAGAIAASALAILKFLGHI